jgi:hypothetical protein
MVSEASGFASVQPAQFLCPKLLLSEIIVSREVAIVFERYRGASGTAFENRVAFCQ